MNYDFSAVKTGAGREVFFQ